MTWVVFGHAFMQGFSVPAVRNSLFFLPLMRFLNTFKNKYLCFSGEQGLAFEAILNALPSVDSFFMMGGTLTAYIIFKELDMAGSNVARWLACFLGGRSVMSVPGMWSPQCCTTSIATSASPYPTLSSWPSSSLSCPT